MASGQFFSGTPETRLWGRCLALLLAATAPFTLHLQAAPWKSTADNCMLELPPAERWIRVGPTDGEIRLTLESRDSNRRVMLLVAELPDATDPSSMTLLDEKYLRHYGAKAGDQNVVLGGQPAQTFTGSAVIKGQSVNHADWLMVYGNRLYAISALQKGTAKPENDADIRSLVQSFRLIKTLSPAKLKARPAIRSDRTGDLLAWTFLGLMVFWVGLYFALRREWAARIPFSRDMAETLKNPVVLSLMISLTLHASGYVFYRAGQRNLWWRNNRLLALAKKKPNPTPDQLAKANMLPAPTPIELQFVEVDPSQIAEPPKETPFIGAANTKAANPVPDRILNRPDVPGKEQDFVKVIKDAPVQPAPREEPKPAPPAELDAKAKAQETQKPGDLAMLKPVEKPNPNKAPPEPNAADTEKTTKPRPRKLSEIKGAPGERSRQEGGVRNIGEPTLDVRLTGFGSYDQELIRIIRERWYHWIEQRHPQGTGVVLVEFQLHHTGRVSNVRTTRNNAGEIPGIICEKSILDPAPYPAWPIQMRRELPTDTCDIRITFHYE